MFNRTPFVTYTSRKGRQDVLELSPPNGLSKGLMDQASTYRSESDVKKESHHLPGRDNLERVVSIEGRKSQQCSKNGIGATQGYT